MTGRSLSVEAIGTRWRIDIAEAMSDVTWRNLERAIHDRIEQFDKTYSRFRKDSLVTRMATQAGEYTLPEDSGALLDFYEQLYRATNGLVTPLIGKVLAEAGYDAEYSLRPAAKLIQPPVWEEAIERTDTSLLLKQPVLLDFGAAGKGYLIDLLGELLASRGLRAYVIDASGDILHRSDPSASITVGLENPFNPTEAIGTAHLSDASLCASSGSRRHWGKYHHIINPITLESPTDIAATWVIAHDAMHADGLATALFFVPSHTLADFSFEYAILRHDMSLEYSEHMPITLFGEET